jgi:hypothetical protein
MNNVLKSPNENTAPMEKDKDEADKGKKGRDKPGDPRIASERYGMIKLFFTEVKKSFFSFDK